MKFEPNRPYYFRRLRFLALLVFFSAIALTAWRSQLLVRPAQAVSSGIVISQVYGGGGNTGSTYRNDFIELFNLGASPVNVNGWSVQYASATGTTWQVTNLTNVTIQPGQYYLVQEAQGAGGTTNLPTPDATGTIAMSATAGKVALVNTTTALTGACPTGATIIDFVGFGATANCFEGTGPTPAPSNTTADLRNTNGCTDSDQNATDFTAGAPNPRNTASPFNVCGGGGGTTISITNVALAEGNVGPTTFSFMVNLSAPAGVGGVTFDIATQDNTATLADNDYVQRTLTAQTIAQGSSSYQFDVTVNGDTNPEPNETFFVNVTNVVGATPASVQGTGTINNDDAVVLTPIHSIQGSGNTSPLSGVVTTSGIVTGVRSNGFFIQEPDATVDADPNTSEGIFVFTSSAPPAAAAVGNSVQVTGTISEFIPSTDTFSPSQTELTSPTTNLLTPGNPLPVPHTITGAETTSPNDYNNLERFEGMRVTVPSMTAISGTQGTVTESSATSVSTGIFYGVVTGVPRPFREPGIRLPDTVPTPWPSGPVPANVPRFDFNPERLRVNSKALTNSNATLDVVSGQVLTNVTGPLDYGFRTYTIDTDAAVVGVSGASTFISVPTQTATELTIGSFNMERFFDTVNDPATSDVVLTQAAFDGRLNKASLAIRNVLRSPDVIGVEEMEAGLAVDNSILQMVADKVNLDAGTPGDYQAFLARGNDIGGINVGFLVKTSKVTVFSVTQHNKTETYTDPGTGPGTLLNDRPPLVLRASVPNPAPFGGTFSFTVIANHMRSLSGIGDLTTAHTRVKKQKQAESLATLIHAFESSGDPLRVAPFDNNIVTLGDLNAFQFNDGYCDVVGTLLGTPPPADQVVQPTATISTDMKDLIAFVTPATQQYSYSFDGDAQAIDHELVNHSMLARFSRLAYGRMDADYPELFRSDFNRPERLSDHDPSVAYFDLSLLAPTATDGNVTGHIVDSDGVPISGVGIGLGGTQNRLTVTDAAGNYHFDNVETNGFYTITPSRANYSFNPASHSFSALGHHIDATFSASYTGERANPLDTTEYFVRQQYLDFLGREPEEFGFTGWVNTIRNCAAGDTSCDRVHVSEMFFRSAEFQQRGYFLYRFYSAAFGRKPDYAEFAPDLARVSGFLTNDQLEAAKAAFTSDFISRPAFTAQYGSLNNAEYVDALMNTARVSLSNRQAMIDGLNSGTQTRAAVLRQIAESGEVYARNYNKAFVVMEYFGYLQRDPDALYLNWVVVLDASPSDSRRMVEGFVNSAEYRNRFAP